MKHSYIEENYLNISNLRQRSIITNLRISCHKLRIETGRYNRTPLEQRICQFCNLGEVEDEIYFIVDCPLYSSDRNILFNYVASKFPHFRYLNSKEKFSFLIAFDKPILTNPTALYIDTISKKREVECTSIL